MKTFCMLTIVLEKLVSVQHKLIKKLVVIGDAEISENLCVGTTITAQRAVFSGVVTVTDGLDIGVGGTFVSFDKLR